MGSAQGKKEGGGKDGGGGKDDGGGETGTDKEKKKKKKKQRKGKGGAADEHVHISGIGLNFKKQVFTTSETRKLKLRYDALANGRNHISRKDFLSQPEVGCNPLIERVIEVVLEENGHSTRRYFEGRMIESTFGTGEKERDIGIHFDPAVMAGPKKKTPLGAIIEEVVPGGVGAMKQNLHSGMRLVAVRGNDDDDWQYCMGKPYKTAQKMVFKAKRPMTLLFQDPEDPKIEGNRIKKLKAVDKVRAHTSAWIVLFWWFVAGAVVFSFVVLCLFWHGIL
jgi:hypothetical protein